MLSTCESNVNICKRQWHEVSFKYEQKESIVSIDAETYQNALPDTKSNSSFPNIIDQQKLCPDFKHIYKFLTENELPDDEKVKRMVII